MTDTPIATLPLWGWQINPLQVSTSAAAVLAIPAVWSAVRFKAETLASLDAQVIDTTAEADEDAAPVVVKGHPVVAAFNKSRSMRLAWLTHATLGNGYLRLIRRGTAVRFVNLPSGIVRPFISETDGSGLVAGEKFYEVRGEETSVLTDAEVLHHHGLTIDGVRGIDVTSYAAPSFRWGQLIDAYLRNYLQNKGHVSGYLYSPNGVNQKAADAASESWRQYQGVQHAGATPHLIGTEYKPISGTNADGQILEQKSQFTRDIAAIFRVPPSILYQSDKYVNTSAVQLDEVTRFGLRNDIEAIESEATAKLLTEAEQARGWVVRLDTSGLKATPVPNTPPPPTETAGQATT